MWHYGFDILMWLIVWSSIGSTLGFFSIRNKPTWSSKQRLTEYIKSVAIGIFFSLPIYAMLKEYQVFSSENIKSLNIMIAGSISFAITDLIIKLWPKLMDGIGKAIGKFIDHLISKL